MIRFIWVIYFFSITAIPLRGKYLAYKNTHNNRINTIYYIRHCRFVFSLGVYGGKIQLDLYSSKRVMQALTASLLPVQYIVHFNFNELDLFNIKYNLTKR